MNCFQWVATSVIFQFLCLGELFFSILTGQLLHYTRKLKSEDWWEQSKAQAIQLSADVNNMKPFCSGLKAITASHK